MDGLEQGWEIGSPFLSDPHDTFLNYILK